MNLVLSVVLILGSVFCKHSRLGLGTRMRSLGIKRGINGASRLLLLWTCWWRPAGTVNVSSSSILNPRPGLTARVPLSPLAWVHP